MLSAYYKAELKGLELKDEVTKLAADFAYFDLFSDSLPFSMPLTTSSNEVENMAVVC